MSTFCLLFIYFFVIQLSFRESQAVMVLLVKMWVMWCLSLLEDNRGRDGCGDVHIFLSFDRFFFLWLWQGVAGVPGDRGLPGQKVRGGTVYYSYSLWRVLSSRASVSHYLSSLTEFSQMHPFSFLFLLAPGDSGWCTVVLNMLALFISAISAPALKAVISSLTLEPLNTLLHHLTSPLSSRPPASPLHP